MPPSLPLGEMLVDRGLLGQDQLAIALREQAQTGARMLGETLVGLGFISDHALQAVLAESAGRATLDLERALVDPAVARVLPRSLAEHHRMLPVARREDAIHVAMADIYDVVALDQLARHFPPPLTLVPLATPDASLADAIDRAYGYEMSIDGLLRELESGAGDGDDPLHPAVRLVDALMLDAVKQEASDLHFEPEGPVVRLRHRLDGVLHPVRTLHRDVWPAMVVRLKIMAGMDIAEGRLPQDGRVTLTVAGRAVDFRIATHPTVHGENVVVRILDRARGLVPLDHLGFAPEPVALLRRLTRRPEGLVVITGPTGSGKTTTLYSLLGELNTQAVNIMTLETPVEYRLPLVRQTEIPPNGGMNYAEGLRSILRQDPDVVFVGEIRDEETGGMALRAAMTGHLVVTTLHTPDALGVPPRLMDLGMSASHLAGTLIAATAQRLVRTLCPRCRQPRPATEAECARLGVPADPRPTLMTPMGCAHCRHTGYRGREPVMEILPFDTTLTDLVAAGAPRGRLRQAAWRQGFRPLAADGVARVLAGTVSLEALEQAVDLDSLTPP